MDDEHVERKANVVSVAISLDIGGTKIAAGIVDSAGKVLARRTIPTQPTRGGRPVLDDTLALAQSLSDEAIRNGWQLAGIGISICELVDPLDNITSEYTIQWRSLPIRPLFETIAPIVIEADVRAHALAEARFGAGRSLNDFVFVTVGTGISSCLVQKGKPHVGANGNALVLSTMPVTVFDEQGRKIEFALESFSAGAGLVERYRLHKPHVTRVEEIVADADAGNEVAAAVLRTGGEALGSAIAWLVNVLDPEAIIVGGGLGLAGGLYWQSALPAIRSHIFADNSRDLPILQATCGADAGLIGAAVKVFQSLS